MWRETIYLAIWSKQWHLLRKGCELIAEALELIQSIFSAEEIPSAEMIRYVLD